MLDKLENAIKKIKGEYIDVRWEERQLTRIIYSHKDIKEIGTSIMSGGNIRALTRGALVSSTLTNLEDLEKSIEWTYKSSLSSSEYISKKISFSEAEIIKDKVKISPKIDPRKVSIEEKKSLLEEYNEIILSTPGIQTSNIVYRENSFKKYFVNSEGTIIEQEGMMVGIRCGIIAKKGNIVQTVGLRLGGGTDYSKLLNRHEEIKNKVKIAVELLSAPPVKGGIYTAVLNGDLAGVFAHESFGHFSEADIVLRNRELKDKMKLGQKIGTDILNITDDSNLEECPGSFKYDDDGVRGRRTELIKDGVLVGRLHSRETAAEFNEPLSGNSRAANYSYSPAVRMSNIFIEPGKATPEELISSVKKGIYLLDAKGGQTIGDQFSFGAQYGYLIENGKLTQLVRDINISGNLFTTLKNIIGIANDLKISEGGGCGKGTAEGLQMLDKSGTGGPHICIKDVIIGGVI